MSVKYLQLFWYQLDFCPLKPEIARFSIGLACVASVSVEFRSKELSDEKRGGGGAGKGGGGVRKRLQSNPGF